EMRLLAKLWIGGNKFATAHMAAASAKKPQPEASNTKRSSASIVSAIISRAKKVASDTKSAAALEEAAAMERKRLENLYGTQAPTPYPTPAPAVVVVSHTHVAGAYPYLLPNRAHPRNIKRDAMACQRQCELLLPCRYGTFIAGGEHRGECWLSAHARPSRKAKLCGFPCVSFAKQAYKPAKATRTKRKIPAHKTWMQRAMQRIKHIMRTKTPTPQPQRAPTPRPTMLTMRLYRERMQRQKMEVARKARKRQEAEERARALRQRAQAAMELGFRAVNASTTEQWATWPYCFHAFHMTFAQCAEHCLAINECVYGTVVTGGSQSGSCFLAASHGTAE
ncbi:MAG: hypothetical protein VX315_06240, partial [Pseudomonadota bacterium]|nr:hypothetical protein [Pseudomonadota bacterium]